MRAASAESIAVTVAIPRDQLPQGAPPDLYSQRNCDLLGLDARAFLELLRRPGAPSPMKIGKLRCVPREEMLAFMTRLREQQTRVKPLDGADRLLLGLNCAPRARGSE